MTKWVCTRSGNSLQHHGIKGQKWGRRRYQNADGSLTAAGKKRYRDDAEYTERELAGVNKKPASVDDYKRALNTTKAVSDSVDSVKKFKSNADGLKDNKTEKRIRKSIEDMSDKELQQVVQRLNMEDNYARMMMNREHLNQGESFVSKALDISTVALKGATTALTIALLVKQLKE